MDPAKWQRDRWTAAKLADYAERFVDPGNGHAKWWSEWGQVYEHRAVIIQENVLTERQQGGFGSAVGVLLVEAKVHVAFGRPVAGRIQALPFDGNTFLDVAFSPSDPSDVRCLGGRKVADEAAQCARVSALLDRLGPRLAAAAASCRLAWVMQN